MFVLRLLTGSRMRSGDKPNRMRLAHTYAACYARTPVAHARSSRRLRACLAARAARSHSRPRARICSPLTNLLAPRLSPHAVQLDAHTPSPPARIAHCRMRARHNEHATCHRSMMPSSNAPRHILCGLPPSPARAPHPSPRRAPEPAARSGSCSCGALAQARGSPARLNIATPRAACTRFRAPRASAAARRDAAGHGGGVDALHRRH